jgi:Tol biopolymer transport system component/DNA-binding winged helix-turn-helix (wHTH) protein
LLGSRVTPIRIGEWTVSPALNQLERDGESTKLEPRAMDLLMYLANARERVVSSEELLREVWHGRVFDDGVVYKKINQLRKALGDDPQQPRFIETIPKRGYRLVANVDVAARAADTASSEPAAANPRRPWYQRRLWGTSAALGVIAIALATLAVWSSGREAPLRLQGPMGRLTAYEGDERDPSWSPDGTRVAFAREVVGGGGGIYVTYNGSTAPMLVAETDGVVRSPRWLPTDGSQIAFLEQRDQTSFDLMLVSALGGKPRQHASARMPLLSTVDGFPLLAWTRDGTRLLFTSLREGSEPKPVYAFHLLTLGTGSIEPFPLAADADQFDTSPAFSPDGARLAFTRYRSGQRLPQLMVQQLGPDLTPQGLPWPVPGVPPGIVKSPSWSPDGNRLMFVVNNQVYEWREGGSTKLVYNTSLLTGGLDVTWRDGSARAAIAFAAGDVDIWALRVDPVTHTAVGAPTRRIHSTAGERHPRFSPDGLKLAFTSVMSGYPVIYVSEVNGENPRALSDIKETIVSSPDWSHDSKQIVFYTSAPNQPTVLYLVDVDQGTQRPLGNGAMPRWSGDDRYVYAFVGRDGGDKVVRIRVADGLTETLFSGSHAVETVEGHDLLYLRLGVVGIFARARAGSPAANAERILVEDSPSILAGFTPVRGGFYYLANTPLGRPRAIRFFDYGSQQSHDVATAPLTTDFGMTVSPDGRELLYPAHADAMGFDVMTLEFEVP